MNKGGKQGEGREGSQSLCIFRSIYASSGPELRALPHQICVGFNSSNDSEPFPPERALSSSLVCPVSSLLRVGRKQEPACSARCGALLEAPWKYSSHMCLQLVLFHFCSGLLWAAKIEGEGMGGMQSCPQPLAGHWARLRAEGSSLQLEKQLFH